ncbi:hypothetical protein SPI_05980 [Niveomyces insectorum RCEF 264]|uniref:Uncharacterized protein n=1 Tax=Niveomyces insectorum RCEF 264 TaxID=1081102 RepID=A0A167SNH1_9HYPO|nr:hypothetical protein SPI_05980 [Niveomyces insectorum RCEF 264]
MSGTLKNVLQKQYKAAFARWPKDRLRPDLQLQEVLNQNLADRLAGRRMGVAATVAGGQTTGRPNTAAAPTASTSDLSQLRQVNALFSLLDDRYKKLYHTTGSLMTPRSNPTYYDDLMTELREVPTRSFFGRLRRRIGGMFRIS